MQNLSGFNFFKL